MLRYERRHPQEPPRAVGAQCAQGWPRSRLLDHPCRSATAATARFEILEGSLYPALHRLERDGLVTSSWANAAGRKRRVYKLSRKGRATLAQQERDWRRFERAMNLILAGR